jgi:hypothetical protein
MVIAALAEQPMGDHAVHVKFVQHRISILNFQHISAKNPLNTEKNTYLAQTSSEDNNLINLAHLLKETVYAWPLNDVYIMPVVFDFDRNDIVGLLN